jgi:rhodanese-related sulfurtransferase
LKEPNPIVWVDARPDDLYKMGHIPGALNLNRTNWDKALSQLFGLYAPGKEVIVYCSAGCSESEEIANQIRNLGLEPVLFLEGGFDAWQKANPNS